MGKGEHSPSLVARVLRFMTAFIRTAAMTACAFMVCAYATPSMALDPAFLPLQAVPTPIAPAASQPTLPLSALVEAHLNAETADVDQECIATAVYFEARGEPVEGQLAVAEVVLNRARSGKYPASICAVVKQASQFSFVRRGKIPRIAKATESWRRAVAIAHIARERLAQQIGADVLWYHANYVSPGWGRRLNRVTQIGAHIFYSATGGIQTLSARL